MAKEAADQTTIDLFIEEKRPGRPRTNPYPREVQLKINKRNQIKRDKSKGLKRVEFKIHQSLFEKLERAAREKQLSRSDYLEQLLINTLADN
jgi:hypothetical protein